MTTCWNFIRCALCAVAGTLLLSACANTPKNVIRQGEGPTVVEILEGGGEGSTIEADAARERARQRLAESVIAERGFDAYTRTAQNEIQQLFPVLPNPTILLYVHPHHAIDGTTQERFPVPGYSTEFPLYRHVQYAMPGELPPSQLPVAEPYPPAQIGDTGSPFFDGRGTP